MTEDRTYSVRFTRDEIDSVIGGLETCLLMQLTRAPTSAAMKDIAGDWESVVRKLKKELAET